MVAMLAALNCANTARTVIIAPLRANHWPSGSACGLKIPSVENSGRMTAHRQSP
jgi:hypothetical protein